jgi:hypothetical protein
MRVHILGLASGGNGTLLSGVRCWKTTALLDGDLAETRLLWRAKAVNKRRTCVLRRAAGLFIGYMIYHMRYALYTLAQPTFSGERRAAGPQAPQLKMPPRAWTPDPRPPGPLLHLASSWLLLRMRPACSFYLRLRPAALAAGPANRKPQRGGGSGGQVFKRMVRISHKR